MITRLRTRSLAAVCLAFLFCADGAFAAETVSPTANQRQEYDLVIYGGTAGGIIAAISAAREGAKVVVLEPTGHIGGMVTGGLGQTDVGIMSTIGGVADEFYRRMNDYYNRSDSWKSETKHEFLKRLPNHSKVSKDRWAVHEPSAAAKVFQQLLEETNVQIKRQHRAVSVSRKGARIYSLRCANGTEWFGRVFIDATYEGDLMALAGVSHRADRESKAEYNESLAGVLLAGNPDFNQPKEFFGQGVDPFVKPGDAASGLLPGIQKGARGEPGVGDHKVQAYNFRICLTDHPENRIPITKPDRYDPKRYELLGRWIETQSGLKLRSTRGSGGFLLISELPNRKTDINDGGVFSTDYIGANWDYPNGDLQTRTRIIQDHVDFTKGLLYFIGHDSRVPESVRNEMRAFGYAKDEYPENGHWSPQLYIREARRMVGQYVMTQHDTRTRRSKEDSVGLGSYGLDSHHVQRVVHNGQVINEGNFTVGPRTPYEIPYRALTPQKAECENLLVTFCLSASHVAFGSIRMEPVFMILSESAGVAAAMAARDELAVQDVDTRALQKRLLERKQIIKLNRIGGGEVIELKAKDTVTALEMNHGDTLRFQLRNGETRTLVLEDTTARIVERVTPGGTIYTFSLHLRIDGQRVELVRYASTQQAFYEPYVINGIRIWPDTAKRVFDLIPIRHPTDPATGVRIPRTGHMDATPRKDVRLAIQDATLRVCPDETHPWTDDPRDFIDVARCYGGDDTHLGAFLGKLCHVGLDINHPKGSPLFAPIDFDTQAWFNSVEMGHNNNRWRGVRRWENGDVWALQTHHLIELLVPEHSALEKGTKYATSAGVHVGAHEHTHFEFKVGRPRPGKEIDPTKTSITNPIDFGDESELVQQQPEVLHLDPWIFFRQIFEDVKTREGKIRADMLPPSPAKTGDQVKFSAEGSRAPSGKTDIKYYWTFGDGGWAIGVNPTYRYVKPGIYPVTLVVASGEERATRTMHLTVSGKPIENPALAITSEDPSFRIRPAYVADVYGWPVRDIPHTVSLRARSDVSKSQTEQVLLTNIGGGTLGQTKATIEYESGRNWLNAIHSGEGNQQSLSLAAKTVGLQPGNYFATVSVTCDGALNSAQGFRVELNVTPQVPPAEQIIDDRDPGFYSTPYFWVGHRFSRSRPQQRGHGGFYLSSGGRSSLGEFVRFTPNLATGKYQVLLSEKTPFPKESQFTARVRHAGGEETIRVAPQNSRSLGTFSFNEATPAFVELSAADSSGNVIADAIRFVPVKN